MPKAVKVLNKSATARRLQLVALGEQLRLAASLDPPRPVRRARRAAPELEKQLELEADQEAVGELAGQSQQFRKLSALHDGE